MKTYLLTEDSPWGKKGEEISIADDKELGFVTDDTKPRIVERKSIFILLKLGVLVEKEEKTYNTCECRCSGCDYTNAGGHCENNECAPDTCTPDPTPENIVRGQNTYCNPSEEWSEEFDFEFTAKDPVDGTRYIPSQSPDDMKDFISTKKLEWEEESFAQGRNYGRHDGIEEAKQQGRQEALLDYTLSQTMLDAARKEGREEAGNYDIGREDGYAQGIMASEKESYEKGVKDTDATWRKRIEKEMNKYPARCAKCGEPSPSLKLGDSFLQNVLSGRCFSCVNKMPSSTH
jgi:hypothetical protein